MNDLDCRPYGPGDLSGCLAVFQSNVPTFFAREEGTEFTQFLADIDARTPYLVLTRNATVIACGGLIIDSMNLQARLAWGMVDRAHQGSGLGTVLLETRMSLAQAAPAVVELTLATSQFTSGFYERFGFTVSKITPDGFAAGLDRREMTLRLRTTRPPALL